MRPKFVLSENLSQKVKSPNVRVCELNLWCE